MNLFILRHASAGVRRKNPLLDVKRPLDKDGKRYCLQLAQLLNGMKLQFDLIVSSPLKRSLQTASLVGNETGYESQILLSKALAPEATLADFHKLHARTCLCKHHAPDPPPQRVARPRLFHPRPRYALVAARSAHSPRPLRHLDEELPPENLAEVGRLFL
jgi:hypothetical protein